MVQCPCSDKVIPWFLRRQNQGGLREHCVSARLLNVLFYDHIAIVWLIPVLLSQQVQDPVRLGS